MSVTVNEIIHIMEGLAPPALAEDWDNIGLIVGRRGAVVENALIALDFNAAVLDEATGLGARLVITHHPPIFKGLYHINDDDYKGRLLLNTIESGIAVYSAHTNLDIAPGGTGDTFAELLGLEDVEPVIPNCRGVPGVGRMGRLAEPVTLAALATRLKAALGLDGIRFCGDGSMPVGKVGVCTGSGGDEDYIRHIAAAGCDTYITGDVGFHDAQEALYLGLGLIDATHYASERIITGKLKSHLDARLGGRLSVHESTADGQVFRSI